MKKILMVYSDQLFKDDISLIASTGRFINIANIYKKLGYDVVIATYASEKSHYYCEEKNGFKIHYLVNKKLSKIDNFLKSGKYFAEELEQVEDFSRFVSIVYYGTTLKFSKPLKILASKYNLTVISIVNEWGSLKLKTLVSYIMQKMGIHFVTKNYDGVIGISSFMKKHFDKHKTKCITVPSIFNLEEMPKPMTMDTDGDNIVISYAGTIVNGKDSMAVVLEALSELDPEDMNRITINLYGSSKDQVMASLGEKSKPIMDRISNQIVFKGHFKREALQDELRESTFSILVRPNKSYANAGFPTKFAESLALGVPMISNNTSDISKYLKTDFNGILLKDDSLLVVKEGLKRTLSYNKEQLNEMRRHAYEDASVSFNEDTYKELLNQFMNDILGDYTYVQSEKQAN